MAIFKTQHPTMVNPAEGEHAGTRSLLLQDDRGVWARFRQLNRNLPFATLTTSDEAQIAELRAAIDHSGPKALFIEITAEQLEELATKYQDGNLKLSNEESPEERRMREMQEQLEALQRRLDQTVDASEDVYKPRTVRVIVPE